MKAKTKRGYVKGPVNNKQKCNIVYKGNYLKCAYPYCLNAAFLRCLTHKINLCDVHATKEICEELRRNKK